MRGTTYLHPSCSHIHRRLTNTFRCDAGCRPQATGLTRCTPRERCDLDVLDHPRRQPRAATWSHSAGKQGGICRRLRPLLSPISFPLSDDSFECRQHQFQNGGVNRPSSFKLDHALGKGLRIRRRVGLNRLGGCRRQAVSQFTTQFAEKCVRLLHGQSAWMLDVPLQDCAGCETVLSLLPLVSAHLDSTRLHSQLVRSPAKPVSFNVV